MPNDDDLKGDENEEIGDDAPEINEADMARFFAEMSEEGLTGEELSRRFLDFVSQQARIDPRRVESVGDGTIIIHESTKN